MKCRGGYSVSQHLLWLLAVLGKKEIVVVRTVASEGPGHCRPENRPRKSHFKSESLAQSKQYCLSFTPFAERSAVGNTGTVGSTGSGKCRRPWPWCEPYLQVSPISQVQDVMFHMRTFQVMSLHKEKTYGRRI